MRQRPEILGCLGAMTLLIITAACSPADPPAATATQPAVQNATQNATEASAPPSSQVGPDYIFTNGKVLTVDENFSVAEAVAVTGNVISAVGNDETVMALATANTEVIDLDGRTVTPGLIDNHNHLIYNASIWPNNASLSAARTRSEALDMLAAKVAEIGPGNDAEHVVFGIGGWKPLQFADDPRVFTREELDRVAPDNPLIVGSWGGMTLNSSAMEFAGISRDTPDPEPGVGRIWRNEDGEPTGYFTGSVFLKWELRPLFPEVTAETVVEGLKAAIDDYLSYGITTMMTFNGPDFPESMLYHIKDNFADTPDQKMRILYPPHFGNNVSAWTPEEVANVIDGLNTQVPFSGSDMFELSHFGEHVYLPIPPATGRELTEDDWAIYKEIATAAAVNGWQIAEHAHRHAIIEREIEIYEEINAEHPITDLRWRVEHATTISPDLVERMKALGMVLGLQSHIAISSPESRASTAYMANVMAERDMPPLSDIRDSGIIYGFGSDAFNVGRESPFFSMYWVVTGNDTTGQAYFTRGTLSREEALIGYTRSNAYLIFKDDKLGTLEPGKLADLVVLDRDYMTIPGEEIRDVRAAMTMVDGRIVYENMH